MKIPQRQILENGQRVTNVLQVTYSVNGDGGYVADVSYTGEAQVILFSVSYLYFKEYTCEAQVMFFSVSFLYFYICNYTGEAQVMFFFLFPFLYFYFLFHICISKNTLAQGTGEVSSEQSFEYTDIRFLSLIELFLYSPLDIVTLISLFYPIYLILLVPQYTLAIFYPTNLILFIPQYPPEPAGGYGRK